MYKIIKNSEAIVRKIDNNKSAVNYITKEITPEVSLAIIKAKNYYEKTTTRYNRIYYVLEGELVLNFKEDKQRLHPGDTGFISKETNYELSGSFEAIIINQPAYGV